MQGQQGIVAFLLDIIPNSVIGAFASGNILQVLLFAILPLAKAPITLLGITSSRKATMPCCSACCA